MREKTPIRATLSTFVSHDSRKAGEAVSADTWRIDAALKVDGEPGTPRYVLTEISARTVGLFLGAFPTSVVAEITGVHQEVIMRAAGMSEATITHVLGTEPAAPDAEELSEVLRGNPWQQTDPTEDS